MQRWLSLLQDLVFTSTHTHHICCVSATALSSSSKLFKTKPAVCIALREYEQCYFIKGKLRHLRANSPHIAQYVRYEAQL